MSAARIRLREGEGRTILLVKAVPGAARTRITGIGDRLKVCVAAPPERGRANKALLEALKTFFQASVALVQGASSPHKTVAVSLPLNEARRRLEQGLS